MNIISSSEHLNSGATNMRAVFASVVTAIADRIINIETGKCHYVDGVRMNNPGPSMRVDLGYCNINMRVITANLNIIIPMAISPDIANAVIKCLINRVSTELSRRDAELDADTYVSSDMSFALAECEFVPTASSFHTDRESIQMTKRIFEYSKTTKVRRGRSTAAFVWRVNTDFNKCEFGESIWLFDHSDIHVDLTGLRIGGLTYAELIDSKKILAHFGITEVITYYHNRNMSYTSIPYSVVNEEKKYVNITEDFNLKYMPYRSYRALENDFIILDREDKSTILGEHEFCDAINSDKYALGKSTHCQMCLRRPYSSSYLIQKHKNLRPVYAIICDDCLHMNVALVELSHTYRFYEVESPELVFSSVSDDYGIPKSHMELVECSNYVRYKFARDDTTFAFTKSIHIAKFIETLTQYLDDVRARGARATVITCV